MTGVYSYSPYCKHCIGIKTNDIGETIVYCECSDSWRNVTLGECFDNCEAQETTDGRKPWKCDGDFCPGECDDCPKCWEDAEGEDEEEMKDATRVERTVFLDKIMIQRILGWILIDLFSDRNKEYRGTISNIARTIKDGDALKTELMLMIHTQKVVDDYYELYQKMEAEECAEDEEEDAP